VFISSAGEGVVVRVVENEVLEEAVGGLEERGDERAVVKGARRSRRREDSL
jgi:hypothetical protein